VKTQRLAAQSNFVNFGFGEITFGAICLTCNQLGAFHADHRVCLDHQILLGCLIESP